jgi:hypothetical protein
VPKFLGATHAEAVNHRPYRLAFQHIENVWVILRRNGTCMQKLGSCRHGTPMIRRDYPQFLVDIGRVPHIEYLAISELQIGVPRHLLCARACPSDAYPNPFPQPAAAA